MAALPHAGTASSQQTASDENLDGSAELWSPGMDLLDQRPSGEVGRTRRASLLGAEIGVPRHEAREQVLRKGIEPQAARQTAVEKRFFCMEIYRNEARRSAYPATRRASRS